MDNVLGTDVPALLAQFPSERSDESAAYAQKHSAGGAFGAPAAAAGGGGGGGGGAVPGNPFASLGGGTGVDMSQWLITPSDQATYRNIFQTCNPIDGQCDKSFFFFPIHFGFVLFVWFTRGRTLLSNICSVLPRGHMLLPNARLLTCAIPVTPRIAFLQARSLASLPKECSSNLSWIMKPWERCGTFQTLTKTATSMRTSLQSPCTSATKSWKVWFCQTQSNLI